jgi:ribonuclease J
LDEATDGLRLIPLGGLGEFGLNALVMEWSGHRLLIDAGMLFAGADQPGVDCIVPDYAYLQTPGTLHGMLLTHGHEDHIGSLAFALQACPAPVYGSRLTLGFARRRLRDRGVSGADLRTLTPGQPVELGPFRIHPIRVAHSVIDSLALAIETPAGTVMVSGDFKLGLDEPEDQRTDVETLAAWGDRGVLALLSDSTNAEVEGTTPGEGAVVPAFEEALARTRGKLLVSCFATSVPRIQRVADLARARGRRVGFVGRRMADNAEVARELGALRMPEGEVVPLYAVPDADPSKLCLFVSGSQGEPLSALAAIARGEHPEIGVGPGDTVVLSARAIPGNERAVSRLISNLLRTGCDVIHPGVAKVHVSGHGSREDAVELLRLVRPKYLVPVHGEYRMLARHARLAAEAGLGAEQVLLVEDGEVLALSAQGARRVGRIEAGRVPLDRTSGDEVEEMVLRDRRALAADGIVVPIVVVERGSGRPCGLPQIVTRGFVDDGQRPELLAEAGRALLSAVDAHPADQRGDAALVRERLRQEMKQFFRRRTQRRPMVIPVVMEI